MFSQKFFDSKIGPEKLKKKCFAERKKVFWTVKKQKLGPITPGP